MTLIKVLVVDDSASMRALIATTLSADPHIYVIGQAADALQAREALRTLNPDVMTLDVEMPKMNGLDFLEEVMQTRPLPVIMVSSMTERGTSVAVNAMEIGAVDCIGKPTIDNPDTFADLAEKVREAAQAHVHKHAPRPSGVVRPAPISAAGRPLNGRIVAIGASTGGVEAVLSILSQFPKLCPPTVVTLHLPAPFTKSFVQRLDRLCAPNVAEASTGAPLKPGHIYVAPGTHTHLELRRGSSFSCSLREGELVSGHRPSVDVLFQSVAKVAGANAVGVILTGMGADGAQGLLAMRRAGARTLGQDEASCVVYGMPKVAFQLGAVEKQKPLQNIAAEILDLTSAERVKEAYR